MLTNQNQLEGQALAGLKRKEKKKRGGMGRRQLLKYVLVSVFYITKLYFQKNSLENRKMRQMKTFSTLERCRDC